MTFAYSSHSRAHHTISPIYCLQQTRYDFIQSSACIGTMILGGKAQPARSRYISINILDPMCYSAATLHSASPCFRRRCSPYTFYVWHLAKKKEIFYRTRSWTNQKKEREAAPANAATGYIPNTEKGTACSCRSSGTDSEMTLPMSICCALSSISFKIPQSQQGNDLF